jgi:hypothetical protein
MVKGVNMKKYFFLVIVSIMITISCTTIVLRWPSSRVEEKGDRTVSYTIENDIFTDFLWTTPPFSPNKLAFDGQGKAKHLFRGRELLFSIKSPTAIDLQDTGSVSTAAVQTSANNRYYNLNILGTVIVSKGRMVPKTKFVTEMINVPKTRMVTKIVPRTRIVYNAFTKSYSTQFYNETVTQPEFYMDQEMRTVMKTEWVWETVSEQFIAIPSYTYFSFQTKDGFDLVIYRVSAKGKFTYYIQNTSYLSAAEQQKNFLGQSVDVHLLMIDTDANGYYFDKQDRILFNTWNPYEKGAAYREIQSCVDNTWYHYSTLSKENFLSFKDDPKVKQLSIINANSAYINRDAQGKLSILNLEQGDRIFLNGKEYSIKKKSFFLASIQYGIFHLRIVRPGYQDFIRNFEINDDSPTAEINYKVPKKAGMFKLINCGFKTFKLSAKNAAGEIKTVYNSDVISLSPGQYIILISDGKTTFSKKVTIELGKSAEYDFAGNKLSMHEF